MSHCPVCQTPYTEGETTQCPTCGWDLTPVPHLIGELPEAYKQKEKAKLKWAQAFWSQFQNRAELSKEELSNLRQQNQELIQSLQQQSGKVESLEQDNRNYQQQLEALRKVEQEKVQAQEESKQAHQELSDLRQQNQELIQSLETLERKKRAIETLYDLSLKALRHRTAKSKVTKPKPKETQKPGGRPEFVENPNNRCPVVLLLDTSGSMSGTPIQELNQGLSTFLEDMCQDEQASLSVELVLVTFGGRKTPTLINDFQTVNKLELPELSAGGNTPMGEAIDYALDLLEKRKINYKDNNIGYYRPWLFLITDGAPNDEARCLEAGQRLQQAESERRLLFFTVAVEGANMKILKQIASPKHPPVWLNGLDFRSMFLWLSTSMKRVSSQKVGKAIELPPISWGQISI